MRLNTEALQIAQIKNLRDNFHNTNLPFYLANYQILWIIIICLRRVIGQNSGCIQLKASKTEYGYGCSHRFGEWNDIHPDNEKVWLSDWRWLLKI